MPAVPAKIACLSCDIPQNFTLAAFFCLLVPAQIQLAFRTARVAPMDSALTNLFFAQKKLNAHTTRTPPGLVSVRLLAQLDLHLAPADMRPTPTPRARVPGDQRKQKQNESKDDEAADRANHKSLSKSTTLTTRSLEYNFDLAK